MGQDPIVRGAEKGVRNEWHCRLMTARNLIFDRTSKNDKLGEPEAGLDLKTPSLVRKASPLWQTCAHSRRRGFFHAQGDIRIQ